MDQGGVTWIVAADAAEARIFCERARTGPLHELAELRMAATDEERTAGHREGGDAHRDRHEPEHRFLRRVANRVAREAGKGEFDRLVLMGPPRTLGILKMSLPSELVSRIDLTDPHERKQDDAEALRRHLRDARARSRS